MNRYFLIIALISFGWSLRGQSDENFVKTYTARDELSNLAGQTADDVREEYQYYDGLGRPMQTIIRRGSPNGNDVITPIVYDDYNRPEKNYLPYVKSNTTDGSFKNSWETEIGAFYSASGDDVVNEATYYYSENDYEASPLNRVDKSFGPGSVWRIDNKFTEMVYRSNTTGDAVRLFTVESASITSSAYLVNQLEVTETIDENGTGKVTTFKDKMGQLVLKKVKADASTDLLTYYIYDDFGLLRFVIQPAGVQEIKDDSNNWSLVNDDSFQKRWMFCYEYDHRKRLIAKRVPGSDWIYMVYDRRDRLVLTQSGNERRATIVDADLEVSAYQGQSYLVTGSNNSIKLKPGFSFTASDSRSFTASTSSSSFTEMDKWIFTKYDHLDRPVMTGIYESNSDRATLQAVADGFVGSDLYESHVGNSGPLEGYDSTSFPLEVDSTDLLTVTYYDNYDFFDEHWGSGISHSCPASFCNPKGQVTGSKVRVIGEELLETVTYYDDRYRAVKTISQNNVGGTETITTEYFNKILPLIKKVTRDHVGHASKTIVEEYAYDHMDRVDTIKTTIDGDISTIINTYNELGKLISKKLSWAQTVDYTYNIRGWLKTINGGTALSGNDRFGMEIKYHEHPLFKEYNGNIGQIVWKTTGGGQNSVDQDYKYTYDDANRITSASYYSAGKNSHFDVSGITYDPNGNILTLTRKFNNTAVDILDYDYLFGNQLSSVDDAGNATLFEDDSNEVHEYVYDANGNMIRDLNKDIEHINYNYLNLPELVSFGNDDKTEYTYDATGRKLMKVTTIGDAVDTTHYVDGIHYDTTSIVFVQVPEGKFIFGSGYNYNLTDHLGNVRAIVDESGAVVQRRAYFPFGLEFNLYTLGTENLYKYNGKEEQQETGWYDYGARMYMPDLGRWGVVDPMSEKVRRHTPYNYAFDNPIRYIDPDGMLAIGFYMMPIYNDNFQDTEDTEKEEKEEKLRQRFAKLQNGQQKEEIEEVKSKTEIKDETIVGGEVEIPGEGNTHFEFGPMKITDKDLLDVASNTAKTVGKKYGNNLLKIFGNVGGTASTAITFGNMQDGFDAMDLTKALATTTLSVATPGGWLVTGAGALLEGLDRGIDELAAKMVEMNEWAERAFAEGGPAAVWGLPSDLELKENVIKVDSTLEKVLLLNAYKYDWKLGIHPYYRFSEEPSVGLIAQEVEKVFPELVSEDQNGFKQVSYYQLLPIMIEAIKEQQKTIEKQSEWLIDYQEKIIKLQEEMDQRLEKVEANVSKEE